MEIQQCTPWGFVWQLKEKKQAGIAALRRLSQEDFKFEHRLGYVERTCLEEEGDRRSGGLSMF